MSTTSIEWTDHSINPIRASKLNVAASGFEIASESVGHYCEKISPGCANCYASALQRRFNMPAFKGAKRADTSTMAVQPFLDQKKLDEVLKRRKPTKYFWCDMTDMFGQWVPDEWLDRCFEVMERTPQHTHQVLTKRPERMAEYTCWRWGKRENGPGSRIPPRSIWLGTSVENQATADERIPNLLKCPAAVRFLSCEPLLGPVDLRLASDFSSTGHGPSWLLPIVSGAGVGQMTPTINWVIAGGESGHGARPCSVEWIFSVVEQCIPAGVPCFVKQLGSVPIVDYYAEDILREWALSGVYEVWEPDGRGEWYVRSDCDRYQPPPGTVIRVKLKDKKGGDPVEWPQDLRVRQFPKLLGKTPEEAGNTLING